MYAVKTDEQFFNRFKEIQEQVKQVASYFQNSDEAGMTDLQWDEYNDHANALEDAVIRLLRDADDRITYKEEDADAVS
jgi:hypothetical protein